MGVNLLTIDPLLAAALLPPFIGTATAALATMARRKEDVTLIFT